MKKGELDFNDLADQLSQMRKWAACRDFSACCPASARSRIRSPRPASTDRMLKRQEAIISSMTKQETRKTDVINGSRRKRIAAGAGVDVSDVNKIIKMQRQMADVMKKMGKGGAE